MAIEAHVLRTIRLEIPDIAGPIEGFGVPLHQALSDVVLLRPWIDADRSQVEVGVGGLQIQLRPNTLEAVFAFAPILEALGDTRNDGA